MAKLGTYPQTNESSDIFRSTEEKNFDLGQKVVDVNGDEYRYVKVGGTALVAGKLYDGPATVDNHQDVTIETAGVAGDKTISVTLGATAATANQYAGGHIVICDGTGQGYTYGIKSHPAADLSTALVVTLVDGETLQEATDTSSQACLCANQYSEVIVHAATETGVPVGVAVDDATAEYYTWLKTRGNVSVLADSSTTSAGLPVAASTSTEGAVTLGTGALVEIGVAIDDSASGDYSPVFLTMN